MSIVAIIVTYNPELSRFKHVLNQASKQVNRVVIVDNDSKIKDVLRDLCSSVGNNGDCGIGEVRYGIFSGTLIRADVAARVCCRDDFFLDQADHDMYPRIREFGYLTLSVNCKLVDHRLGTVRWPKYYIS